VTGWRLPGSRSNRRAESAEGQRPRPRAYQIVPLPHASVPNRKKGEAVAGAALTFASHATNHDDQPVRLDRVGPKH
jgi:hypothetical protein